jgi:hypothetical protein
MPGCASWVRYLLPDWPGQAGLGYRPARRLGQPGPGAVQCLLDRVYLTGARMLPAPAAAVLAALVPPDWPGLRPRRSAAPSPLT